MDFEIEHISKLFFDQEDYDLTNKEKIGEGSLGTVYIVKNKEENKDYAAKYFNIDDFDTKKQIMFLNEAVILHQLNHRSIIKLKGINYQVASENTQLQPVIMTDYYKNKSLRDVLENQDLDPTQKHILLLGISNALRYLHKKGIVHRDLKPESILIDENFYPYISDFGLSRDNKCNAITNLTMDKNIYNAPEILKEEQPITSAVDVYSFALIAFEIVSGKTPFDNSPLPIAIEKIKNGERPKFASDVNKQIKELIERCWSRKAKDRPSFDEIFSVLSNNYSKDADKNEIQKYLERIKKDDEISFEKKIEQKPKVDEKKKYSSVFSCLLIFVLLLSLICENLFIFVLNDKCPFFKDALVKNTPSQDRYLYFGLDMIIGNKGEYDPTKASNFFMSSSLNGSCLSSYILGLMFENGNGVKQNFDRALYYYNKSYEQNNQYGYLRIGTCYLNGYGVEQNYFRSFKIFDKLANDGNSDALNILGKLYAGNIGNDSRNTVHLLSTSSLPKNSLKTPKRNPFKHDIKKAIECYEKAANLGNPEAMHNLGDLYENGKGVVRNIKKAIEWYEKAANLGNSEAMYSLGVLYENGKGVEQNRTKAIGYYKKSAELGNSKAKEKLT